MSPAATDTFVELGPASDGEPSPIRVLRRRMIVTRALIAGMSGAGKSYLIRRWLEATLNDTLTFVLDREADFATLREHHDVALIGPTGELPTSVATAAALARGLVEMHVSAVIDLSGLTEIGEKQRFVSAFLRALIDLPREQWTPMQIVLDEAHEFAPEGGASESRDAVVALMTLGRKRAMCGILATPRLAMLSKDASAPAGNYMIGRFALDNDVERAAKDLGFKGAAARSQIRELADGEFYAHGSAFEHRGIRRFITGPVLTTHDPDQMTTRPPAPSKRVKALVGELAALQSVVTDIGPSTEPSPASSSADRERIADLEKQLAEARAINVALRDRASEITASAITRVLDELPSVLPTFTEALRSRLVRLQMLDVPAAAVEAPAERRRAARRRADADAREREVVQLEPVDDAEIEPARPRRARQGSSEPREAKRRAAGSLRDRILGVLLHRGPSTMRQIAFASHATPSNGTFQRYLRAHRAQGHITTALGDGLWQLTSFGYNEAQSAPVPLEPAELRAYWIAVQTGGKRDIVTAVASSAEGLTLPEIAYALGKQTSNGTFQRYVRSLRRVGIIVEGNDRRFRMPDELDVPETAPTKARPRARTTPTHPRTTQS